MNSGNPEVVFGLFTGHPQSGALTPSSHWTDLNRSLPGEAAVLKSHVDALDSRLRQHLPAAEASELRIQTVELRWVAGDGPEVTRPGHLDGKRAAITVTTALVGRGTQVQNGPGPRLDPVAPLFETPRGQTLLLTGLGRTQFYADRDVAMPATLHEAAPMGAQPRLLLIVRYRYAPRIE